jgi:hypothetical protein
MAWAERVGKNKSSPDAGTWVIAPQRPGVQATQVTEIVQEPAFERADRVAPLPQGANVNAQVAAMPPAPAQPAAMPAASVALPAASMAQPAMPSPSVALAPAPVAAPLQIAQAAAHEASHVNWKLLGLAILILIVLRSSRTGGNG